jgi:hypothetical protein
MRTQCGMIVGHEGRALGRPFAWQPAAVCAILAQWAADG